MSFHEMSSTEFLNIDLDLEAESGLDVLEEALSSSMFVLHRSEQTASFEMCRNFSSLDETAVEMCKVINGFSEAGKAAWDKCSVRSFNIGIQSGAQPHQALFGLSNTSIRSIANLKCDLVITVYA